MTSGNACSGSAVQLTYTGTGSSKTKFYWDFDGGVGNVNAQNPAVTWNTAGQKTITLYVVDNNCVSAVVSTTVQIYPIPTATFSLPTQVCVGDSVRATYTGISGAGAGFQWNFGTGSTIYKPTPPAPGVPTPTNLPGPYVLKYSVPGTTTVSLQVSENGCQSVPQTRQITVLPLPLASIDPVASQCFDGNSFIFSSGSHNMDSYTWSLGASANPPMSNDSVVAGVTYNTPGSKLVTLTVTKNGCVSKPDTATFDVWQMPEADFAMVVNGVLGGNSSACANSGIQVQYTGMAVSPNQVYKWTFQDGNPGSSSIVSPGTITFTSGGTKVITLEVTYQNVCKDQLSQTVNILPALIADAGVDMDFCEGDGGVQVQASVTGGLPPYSYVWTGKAPAVPASWGISNPFAEDPTMNPTALPTAANNGAADMVYQFKVIDANGCQSNTDEVTVTVKAKPRMSAGADRTICETGPGAYLNGGVTASNVAPAPISFQWVPATSMIDPTLPNPYVRPSGTTTYMLMGTSINGCSSVANNLDTVSNVVVKVNPNPTVDAGADQVICKGGTASLLAIAAGAGPNYDFSWTPTTMGTVSTPLLPGTNVTPLATTTYTVTVSSNNCPGSDSVTITVLEKPTVTIDADSSSICYGESVQLNAQSDVPGSTFTWTQGGSSLSATNIANPIATPRPTGLATKITYTVVATGGGLCKSDPVSKEISVRSAPTVTIAPLSVNQICGGTPVNLTTTTTFRPAAIGATASYAWTASNSTGTIDDTTNANVVVTPTQTTKYTVVATYQNCKSSASIDVQALPQIIVSLSADTTLLCSGTSTQLTATSNRPSTNWSWEAQVGGVPANVQTLSDSTISNPVASPLSTTTYTVTGQEGICRSKATVTLTVNPSPEADYFASQTAGCVGTAVAFQEAAKNAIAYVWDFGDGSPIDNQGFTTHVYNTPGVYTATFKAIGAGNCTTVGVPTSILIKAAPVADFASLPAYSAQLPSDNGSVAFSWQGGDPSIVGWAWDFGDGTSSSAPAPVHTYTQAGTYSVQLTVTDSMGCTASVSHGTYTVYSPEVNIPNLFTPNGDGANDTWRMSYTGSQRTEVQVYDRWGRQVYSAINPVAGWDGKIAGSGADAPAGVYFYVVKIANADSNREDRILRGEITLMR